MDDAKSKVWIFGAGHVGQALANLVARLNFDVIIVDERGEWADPSLFDDEVEVRDADPLEPIRRGEVSPGDWVLIMTHSHPLDEDILRALSSYRLAFLGMIGSRGKWARFAQRLQARGVCTEFIESVRCPVGLDIGAQTPMEIAFSIVAQMVSEQRGGPKWALGEQNLPSNSAYTSSVE